MLAHRQGRSIQHYAVFTTIQVDAVFSNARCLPDFTVMDRCRVPSEHDDEHRTGAAAGLVDD